MSSPASLQAVAFEHLDLISEGPLAKVAAQVRRAADRPGAGVLLVFDAVTSETIELDLRGSVEDVVGRLGPDAPAPSEAPADAAGAPPAPRGRGRPRLGVVAREVTLLPRHWDWLASQPGGASVALRKLVEEARRVNAASDAARVSRDAAYRFMSVIASGLPSFEEASRALFAGRADTFDQQVAAWPAGVRTHLLSLARGWFAAPDTAAP